MLYRRLRMTVHVITLSVFCLFVMTGVPVDAQNASGDARVALTRVGPAVVSLRVIASIGYTMDGREMGKEDEEMESSGVVIRDDGLAVVSLSATDPAAAYEALMQDMMGEDYPDFRLQSDVKDIRMRLADGRELSCEVVMRDRDLDLAFIKPKTRPDTALPIVDLADAGELELLDSVILVSRLGRTTDWVTYARTDHVNAILTKPRKMYLLTFFRSPDSTEETGALVLSQTGKVVGVQLQRKVMSVGTSGPDIFAAVLPAKDILAVANQVPN